MASRDLGDVQEVGKPTLERLGDESVGLLERVAIAIESDECVRPPQPGQELVEPVRFSESFAENRLEQLQRAGEVPADELKTALA